MAKQLKKFSTYLGLRFAQNIFRVYEQVASTLQKPSITAQTTITWVNSLNTNLLGQRDDFYLFYGEVVSWSAATNFIDHPKLLRPKQVPQRFQQGVCDEHHFQFSKEFHRVQCVEAIDTCMAAMEERFDQEMYSVLTNIETVLINAANGRPFELNEAVEAEALQRRPRF